MTSELWPCSTCGAPGVLNLAAHGYCATHASEVLRSFDPSVWSMNGRWVELGCARSDHGPGYAECECPACGASAVALVGSPCGYCEHACRRLAEWQAEIVLRPPEHDVDNPRRSDAFAGWAQRLGIAVACGVISESEARRAWGAAINRVAA